jgi:hypothetical protein
MDRNNNNFIIFLSLYRQRNQKHFFVVANLGLTWNKVFNLIGSSLTDESMNLKKIEQKAITQYFLSHL